MLVESSDVTGPSEIVAQFLAFRDAEIFPVLLAQEMAELLGGAMARCKDVADN